MEASNDTAKLKQGLQVSQPCTLSASDAAAAIDITDPLPEPPASKPTPMTSPFATQSDAEDFHELITDDLLVESWDASVTMSDADDGFGAHEFSTDDGHLTKFAIMMTPIDHPP